MQEVELIVEILPEDQPVAGNAMCSGDLVYDREVEREILADLADGNDWAWCTVKVTARVDGIEGTSYLGCCSYASEKDFRNGGYYPEMKEEAVRELRDKLEDSLNIVNRTIQEGSDE